jgi:PKD repeat protein
MILRKIIFLFMGLLALTSALAQQNATIVGTVTNASGSLVENQDIYAYAGDSLNYAYASAITDASGHYTMTLVVPSGYTEVSVYTLKACSDPSELAVKNVSTTAGNPLVADFQICNATPPPCTAVIYPLVNGLTVNFFSAYFGADSTNTPVSYLWNFGDGSNSTQANPSHSYVNLGFYTVTLTIVGSNGCTATSYFDLYLNAPPPDSCYAEIKITEIHYLQFQFTALYTPSYSGQTAINYLWNFGDNTTSTLANPMHIYAQPGFYVVTLRVVGSDSCTAYTSIPFSTDFPPFPQCASYIEYTQVDSNTYHFSAFGINANGNPTFLLGYNWNFGDGTTSTDPSPTHTFTQPGFYSVELTAWTNDSCFSHDCVVICNYNLPVDTFWYGCQAVFNSSNADPANPLSMSFHDLSIGGVQTWLWNFGDSTTSHIQNPNHTYQQPGIYTVTLTIKTYTGCESTAIYSLYVGPSSPWGNPGVCQALFIPLPDSLGGNALQFFDLSISPTPIQSWAWDFGDGSSSTEQNPYHVYAQPGTYNVSLTITGDSCNSTISFAINSLAPWNFNKQAGQLGLAAHITAVKDLGEQINYKLFPNPAGNELRIAFQAPASGDYNLRILDLSGRSMGEQTQQIASGANLTRVSTAHLVPGIYFLEVKSAGQARMLRFIKE